ncbi:MAG: hypothetical protein JNK64_04205 [Myxococcales bacterium]|nr:hypothetical protein [Myxococcales bacterium]
MITRAHVLSMLGRLALGASCGASQRGAQASRPPDEFCPAIIAGELQRASAAAHGALVAVGADHTDDASEPLATWLRTQPCVAEVEVPTMVVDTDPAIRELAVTLVPDAAGVTRRCDADLRLAPGGRVGVHPGVWNSQATDPRCTPIAAATP